MTIRIHGLRQPKKVVAPRRLKKTGKRNGVRRRVHNKRTFVQRHLVIAVISALGSVAGEHPGALTSLRLGTQTLLEMVVERVAKCAGGIIVLVAAEGVDAATTLLGAKAEIRAAKSCDLDAILAGIATSDAPVVLVHDLAYPFAGPNLMTKVALGALDHGAAVCVGPPCVDIAEVSDERLLPPIGVGKMQSIAMPQAFLHEALQELSAESDAGAMPVARLWRAVQAHGETVYAVPNPGFNIHIATSLDWLTARKVIWPWLQARYKSPQASRT